MNKNNLKIVFFGTPEFGKIILEKLINSGYKPILVVTAQDKPVGRKQELTPSPVKVLAEKNKIPVSQLEKLYAAELDLIIVAAYGKVLPSEILKIPKYGALNIHPSLLPRWRGPTPIQYAILNGDKETGVTIMVMDDMIDHGSILANSKVEIQNSKFTTAALSVKLAELGAQLLVDIMPRYLSGEIKPQEQIHENAVYTKIISRSDGHIDWGKQASDIESQIRAFTPWPGSFTVWKNRRLKITAGSVLYLSAGKLLLPGQTFLLNDGQLAVQTGMGLFVIEKIKLEGKGEITVKEFLNGYAQIIGATLD
jgi:methionyl-tRNA formyltransferase